MVPVKVILTLICLLLECYMAQCETVLGQETEHFDFDGLPGAVHQFTAEVNGGEEDCYYQNMKSKAQLYFSYEVLQGGSRTIDFRFNAPSGKELDSMATSDNGVLDVKTEEEGVYSFCLDNQNDFWSTKAVSMYMSVVYEGEWDKFAEDLQKLNITVSNFTHAIEKVSLNMQMIKWYQAISEAHSVSDEHILSENGGRVQMWSIIYTLTIMAVGSLQIFFVRRLFERKPGSSSGVFQQRA